MFHNVVQQHVSSVTGYLINYFIANLRMSRSVKKIVKISQNLMKLWATVEWPVFFDSQCIYENAKMINTREINVM